MFRTTIITAAFLAATTGLAAAQPAAKPAGGPPPIDDDMMFLLGGPGEDGPGFGQRGERGPRGERGRNGPRELSAFAKTLDTDADGKLTPEERQAGAESHNAYHAALVAQFDTNTDGTLSDAEWFAIVPKPEQQGQQGNADRRRARDGEGQANRGPRQGAGDGQRGGDRMAEARGKMLERFDGDGDGELSETERQAARAAMTQRTRATALERADKDASGTIDETELAALREGAKELQNRRGQMRDRLQNAPEGRRRPGRGQGERQGQQDNAAPKRRS
jgi:Ca2+-binding EF-hand superfamily protein